MVCNEFYDDLLEATFMFFVIGTTFLLLVAYVM